MMFLLDHNLGPRLLWANAGRICAPLNGKKRRKTRAKALPLGKSRQRYMRFGKRLAGAGGARSCGPTFYRRRLHWPAQCAQSPPQEKSSFSLRIFLTAMTQRASSSASTSPVARFIQPPPSMRPIRRTIHAATHATAHWPTTTLRAHLPPSSRLMEDTAATQGV